MLLTGVEELQEEEEPGGQGEERGFGIAKAVRQPNEGKSAEVIRKRIWGSGGVPG